VMVIVTAAIQSIPADLYEAVQVDGGGWRAKLRYVTWPHLIPTLGSTALTLGILYLTLVTLLIVLTGGGPLGATTTLSFEAFRFGALSLKTLSFDTFRLGAFGLKAFGFTTTFGFEAFGLETLRFDELSLKTVRFKSLRFHSACDGFAGDRFSVRRDINRGLIFDHGRLAATAANLDPDVIAAARRDHVEPIVARRRHLVFDRAELFELFVGVFGEQLRQHPGHRLEIEVVRRNVDRLGADDDVRTLTDVHDERVAISADNRGEQGFD